MAFDQGKSVIPNEFKSNESNWSYCQDKPKMSDGQMDEARIQTDIILNNKRNMEKKSHWLLKFGSMNDLVLSQRIYD